MSTIHFQNSGQWERIKQLWYWKWMYANPCESVPDTGRHPIPLVYDPRHLQRTEMYDPPPPYRETE
jgi:hypothetical protein